MYYGVVFKRKSAFKLVKLLIFVVKSNFFQVVDDFAQVQVKLDGILEKEEEEVKLLCLNYGCKYSLRFVFSSTF